MEVGGTPGIPRRALAVVTAASGLVALTRLATRSRTLYGWDPVNFALALDKLDLVHHQPHPPASIGYVLAGRALRLLVADANLALVVWNALLTVAAGILVFAMGFHAARQSREWHAWLAWVALVSSPLVWFYGSVAEVYLSEMTLGLLVAFCCLRALQEAPGYAYVAVLALAGLGAFRLSAMVFLFPLVLFACWRSRVSLLKAAGLLCVAVGAWFVPLLLQQGVGVYFHSLADQSAGTATATSVVARDAGRHLNRHLRDIAYALMQAAGPFNGFALPLVVLLFRPRLSPRRTLVAFVALWTLPTLAFYALVHMAKPGYVLLAAPAVALALSFYYGQLRRELRALVIAGQLIGGAWFFLAAQPAVGAWAGEGLRYRQKSFAQKLATEASSLTSATRYEIAQADAQLEGVLRELEGACPEPKGAVLVAGDGPGANWRRLLYYAPRSLSIRLPGAAGGAWYQARGRSFTVSEKPGLDVDEACRTFWVLPADSPALRQLREAGLLNEAPGSVYWTRGTISVEPAPGLPLRMRIQHTAVPIESPDAPRKGP